MTAVNIARSTVEAYDFQFDYTFAPWNIGELHLYAVATLQTTLERQVTPSSSAQNSVGYADGPLRWRGNVGATWNSGAWTIGWNAQFYDSYLVYPSTAGFFADTIVANQGSAHIPHQIYHDAFLRYQFGGRADGHGSTDLMLSVQNLFNDDPPTLAVVAPSGGYSPYGDPRLARYTLTLRHSF